MKKGYAIIMAILMAILLFIAGMFAGYLWGSSAHQATEDHVGSEPNDDTQPHGLDVQNDDILPNGTDISSDDTQPNGTDISNNDTQPDGPDVPNDDTQPNGTDISNDNTPPNGLDIVDDSTFEVYFLDVGQGDAACVMCDGKAMLIDGGPAAASRRLYNFLKSNGISNLDYIIASHPDADHVGGLAGALNYATGGTALCTVSEYDSEPFQAFKKHLKKEITVPNPGDTFNLGSATVTILYPDEVRTDNTSIILRIEYGETSFLFTGDCLNEDEEAILSRGYDLKCDVLKVAHHGSKNSTSDAFLKSVDPQYAVISVGDNTYGHPTEEVMSELKNMGITFFRTDVHGDIHCISDGEKITFDVENPDEHDEHPIDPDVTYIGNKNSKVFHDPDCDSVQGMSEKNKWYFKGTREELIDQGYKPCSKCQP